MTDLLICATAAGRRLVVLHDDDFVTAARHLTDLSERRVRHAPEPE